MHAPLLALLLLVAFPARADVAAIDAALRRGTDYLLSKQGDDGAWRSETYGAFKDGYSLSPLVLSALLFAPADPRIEAAYRRGADFVATLAADPSAAQYPVYGVAGALLVLNVPVNARHAAARDTLVAALRTHQLADENGWPADDPSYGGWGYHHGVPRYVPGNADFLLSSNLSATLYAVGALSFAGVGPGDPALRRARTFVERCQNFGPGADGGFFMTPANRLQNKADMTGDGYVSYGTMTADGLRALLRLGAARDDPRVLAARDWLVRRYTPHVAPGDYPGHREVQRHSAYYYWTWTSSHALLHTGMWAVWPRALAGAMIDRQRPDGSWANPVTDLREDDPLLATSFAMAGLAAARMALTGERPTAFPFSSAGAAR